MVLDLKLASGGYDITIERASIGCADRYFRLDRKVLIVTDEGVPARYSEAIASKCVHPYIETVPSGEESKSLSVFGRLCSRMLKEGFTRTDCVVAVGGGVVGDLAGFVAASFMRGVDFYNVPTTLLSQVDSSIGGKVAVNLDGIKNCVGAFYQPKAVLIDPDVLSTLPKRQVSNGLAESIKMAVTFDEELFSILENEDINANIDLIIERSLRIKKKVVEADEKEKGLRKVLNFGHTIGHGIESNEGLGGLYHGECVALGMLPMCSPAIRGRVASVLKKAGLPTEYHGDAARIFEAVKHDKKADGDMISLVFSDKIGSYRIEKISLAEFGRMLSEEM